MTTTTKLGDFLGRGLVNEVPGSSAATDFLGRAVTAGNKDFMGRALVDTVSYPPANVARNTAYSLGDVRRVPGVKEVQTLTGTGTPVGNLKLGITNRGQTLPTGNIATVSQANLQSAINALANVQPGDVVVGGTGPWTLTFAESLGNVTQASADNAGVTGGTYAVTTTTPGIAKGGIVQATVAGTSHASNLITQPAVNKTVVDGTVTWKRLK